MPNLKAACIFRTIFSISALLAFCALSACASPWSTNVPKLDDARTPIPESTLEVLADWNDIDPALLIAASKSQLGLSNRTDDLDGAIFELLTIHDETMLLWATPLEQDTGKPIRMKLKARLEPARDTTREQKFLQALSKRLTQLRGVETAPVD